MSTYNKYQKKINSWLKKNINSGDIILPDKKLKLQNEMKKDLKKKIKDCDIDFLEKVFNEQLKISMIYEPTKDTRECPTGLTEVTYTEVEVPKEYIPVEKHFQELFATPQPEQRTAEWYAFRKGRITASDIATALDHNPYEAWEEFIVKKCDPDYPFYDNDTVFHGKKYEEIATMIYQEIYNTRVTEFGCIPSKTISFLGASPDGICSKASLDYKFCPKLNTMLEIKCPVRRQINTKGKIKGHICPHYYEYQCQVQMQCCELELCDFWQCDIEEITYKQYLENSLVPKSTCGIDESPLPLPEYCHQGCILQFLPRNYKPRFYKEMFNGREQNDDIKFQGFIIYPPHVRFNNVEYNNWVIETLNNLDKTHPDLLKDFYFDKVIYWRLKKCHNVEIKRNDKWFEDYLPVLKDTWDKVEYYREHLDEVAKLKEKATRKRNMWRMKTSYTISSKELTEKKTLFLEKNSKLWEDEADSPVDDCDFVDSD